MDNVGCGSEEKQTVAPWLSGWYKRSIANKLVRATRGSDMVISQGLLPSAATVGLMLCSKKKSSCMEGFSSFDGVDMIIYLQRSCYMEFRRGKSTLTAWSR